MALQGTELREAFKQALGQLSPCEKLILKLRFGWGFSKEAILKEIGEIFQISVTRVSQIERRSIRKLRHPSRSKSLMQAGGRVAYVRKEKDYRTGENVDRERLVLDDDVLEALTNRRHKRKNRLRRRFLYFFSMNNRITKAAGPGHTPWLLRLYTPNFFFTVTTQVSEAQYHTFRSPFGLIG